MIEHPKLAAIAAEAEHAAILLDFDGTLAPIVSRPEDAAIVEGAREVLGSLVSRCLVVAVISGRPNEQLHELVGVEGVRCEGLYGLSPTGEMAAALRDEMEAAASRVPGAWVEPKGVTLALHYRGADDPPSAREQLVAALAEIAREAGYDLLEGKMVFELAPAGESRKGGAVTRVVRETGARAALYAGDDLPDLEAFAALDELAGLRIETVKVAVGGPETPEALITAGDVVVRGSMELVAFLGGLVARPPAS